MGFGFLSLDVATRATWRLEDTGANASSPEPSRDGQSLVFVGYTADGYDLFSLPIASARWTPVEWATSASPDSSSGARGVETAPLPASAIAKSTLLCGRLPPGSGRRRLSPTRRARGRRRARGSADALGRHAYVAEAGWAAGADGPTGNWPTCTTVGGRRSSPTWPTTPIRGETAKCGRAKPTPACCFRVRRVRWSQSVLGRLSLVGRRLDVHVRAARTARRARRGARCAAAGW